MSKLKRDYWVVEDEHGVTHSAMVVRFFTKEGLIGTLQISTACVPSVEQRRTTEAWTGVRELPTVSIGRPPYMFHVMKWNVRKDVTCLYCVAAPVWPV